MRLWLLLRLVVSLGAPSVPLLSFACAVAGHLTVQLRGLSMDFGWTWMVRMIRMSFFFSVFFSSKQLDGRD